MAAKKRYRQKHVTQFDGSTYATANCTPASLANAIRAAVQRPYNGDDIRNVVKRSEETDPSNPGWSLTDARLAAKRLGLTLDIMTGSGWDEVQKAHREGYGLLIQGDSDQFANTTCSGAFDGLHCIYLHPNVTRDNKWRIDDPICKSARLETPQRVRAYAEKLNTRIAFAVLRPRVPVIK
jgi:hypothetical protein